MSRRLALALAAALAAPAPPARAACEFASDKQQFLNGTTLTYRLTITNLTGSGFRGLYVVDTVSPLLMNQTSSAPPEFGTATIYQTVGGTLYTWSYDLGGTGKSILGNGETFTFTITGTLSDACALYGLENTAYFRVAGSGCSGFNTEGTNTVATEANLSVVKTVFPAAPAAGGPVGYAITVTNAGTVTLTSLTVTDTVPPAVAIAGVGTPPGFVALGPAAVSGGSWRGWRDAGGLLFAPGDSFTFTLTGTVAPTCVATIVSNTAFATGLAAGCGTSATRVISNVASFTVPAPPLGMAVVKEQTGGGAAGSPVAYRIVVTNTGGASIVSLLVADTVPAEVTGQAVDQPAAMGAPAVAHVATGTRYVWSAAGLALGPGQSFTFTVTGTVGTVCVPTALANTAYVAASASCGAAEAFAFVAGAPAVPPSAAVSAVLTRTPSVPKGGDLVTYRIVVTNQAAATLTSLVVTDTVSARLVGAAASGPSGWPPASVGPAPGGGTLFVWSNAPLVFAPGTALTFTITGTLADCGPAVISNTAFAVAANACSLAAVASNADAFTYGPRLAAAAAAPGTVSVGQAFSLVLTVTNAGTDASDGTVPDLAVGPGAGFVLLLAGPSPAGPLSVAAGASARFTWTLSATASGTAVFSLTASGLSCSGGAVAAAAVRPVAVQTPAALAAAAAAFPSPRNEGQAFLLAVTVTNTGEAAALAVAPSLPAVSGSGGAAWAAGPFPAAANVPGGGTVVFTFTFTGTLSGTVYLTVAAAGTDANAGWTVSTGPVVSTPLLVQRPAALEAAAAIAPAVVAVGQWFQVRLTVTNTGEASAFVAPVLTRGSTAPLVLVSGPGPAATVWGGSARTFTWTYSPTGPGTLWFGLTGTGWDLNDGAALFATRTVGGAVVQPGRLAASLAVSATSAAPGAPFLVTLTVTNGGEASVSVPPPPLETGGWGTAAVTVFPPPGAVTLPPGGANTWTWALSAGLEGFLVLSATASGTDLVSGLPVSGRAVLDPAVAIGVPRMGAVSLRASPATVELDRFVTLMLTVSNTGRFDLITVAPGPPAVLGDGRVALESGPSPASALVPVGGTATFTWTYRAMRGGTVAFETGAASANGALAGPVRSEAVAIVEAGRRLADAVVYPNPFDRLTARGGTVKFRRMPPGTAVRLYTISAKLVWESVAGPHGFVEWDGTNARGSPLAPGVLIWVMEDPATGERRIGKLQLAR